MSVTSYQSPTSTGETANDWTNPTNAYSSDNTYAVSAIAGYEQDYYDFTIPDIPNDATITGIEVACEGKSSSSGNDVLIKIFTSWDGGSTWGEVSPQWWAGTSDQTITFGSSSELWEHTPWTETELNNTNFRIKIETDWIAATMSLDHIQV